MRLDDDVDDEMEAASIEVPLTTPPSDAAAAAVRTAHLAVRWTMRLGPTASAARSRDAPRVDMLPGKCERGRAGPDLVDMLERGARREPSRSPFKCRGDSASWTTLHSASRRRVRATARVTRAGSVPCGTTPIARISSRRARRCSRTQLCGASVGLVVARHEVGVEGRRRGVTRQGLDDASLPAIGDRDGIVARDLLGAADESRGSGGGLGSLRVWWAHRARTRGRDVSVGGLWTEPSVRPARATRERQQPCAQSPHDQVITHGQPTPGARGADLGRR